MWSCCLNSLSLLLSGAGAGSDLDVIIVGKQIAVYGSHLQSAVRPLQSLAAETNTQLTLMPPVLWQPRL